MQAIRVPALVLLAACASEAPEELATWDTATSMLPTEQAPAVLNDSPEWQLIRNFEEGSFHTGVLYARATARTTTPNGKRCSGFLVDDDILTTADHCGTNGTTRAIFGEFGPSDGNYADGAFEARRRLKQLGVPTSVADSLDLRQLTEFTCNFQFQDGNRDVAYWECPGNDITFTIGSNTYSYRIKPGHVWGHMNVGRGNRPDGRDVYALSVNARCGNDFMNTLLSPGDIEDSTDSCIGSYGSCFDLTTDWVGGSSGGAILDKTTHEVFGVVNGHTWWWFGDADDPCDRWDAAINTGSYIGSGVDTFLNEPSNGWSTGAWAGPTAWVGNTGGTRKYRYCPNGTLAAGIVGTSTDAGQVGNLGLICVPHNTPQALRMDRATVIAGGSIDVGFDAANNADWNTYMHEVLTDNSAELGVQTMAMCPAGSFIHRMQVGHSNFIDRVWRIHCKDPQNGKTTSVYVGGDIGTVGQVWNGQQSFPECPDGAYFAGLWVNSGWVTDGFSGYCRYED
jgi:hypothetical protein